MTIDRFIPFSSRILMSYSGAPNENWKTLLFSFGFLSTG